MDLERDGRFKENAFGNEIGFAMNLTLRSKGKAGVDVNIQVTGQVEVIVNEEDWGR